MNRKIVIHPDFNHLQAFIQQIPSIFLSEGAYLHDGRNKIKIFEFAGLRLNVKRYRIPLFINRLVYVYLRHPKALRAYEYARRLQSMQIPTPTPIAYILEKQGGLLGFSYFISLQVDYPRRFYEFGSARLTPSEQEILTAFGIFTARLHEQGVYHQDYSPGNILFEQKNGQTDFCLVDINRMEFGPVSFRKGCANFARLWGSPQMFRIIARAYARSRHFEEEATCREVLKQREKYWRKVIRKRPAEFPLEF